MGFLDSIVEYINTSLKKSTSVFPTAKYHGVSAQIPKQLNGALAYLPAIVDVSGDCQWLIPDDAFELTAYHKIITSSYSQNKKQSYGNSYDTYQHTYDMEIILMSDRRKSKIDATLLESVIICNMPSSHKLPNVDYVNILPISTNHSSKAIFAQEFSGPNYFLRPEHILISIRYRIEIQYQKGCISLCQCN